METYTGVLDKHQKAVRKRSIRHGRTGDGPQILVGCGILLLAEGGSCGGGRCGGSSTNPIALWGGRNLTAIRVLETKGFGGGLALGSHGDWWMGEG